MFSVKKYLLKNVNSGPRLDLSESLYNFKKSYRYIIAIVFLKSVLFSDNLCYSTNFFNKYWRYIYILLIISIILITYYDFQSAILISTIIMIQKCFRKN